MEAWFNLKAFLLFISCTLFAYTASYAQCDNPSQWPSGTVVTTCGNNTIVTNIYAGEYNVTKGYQDQSYLTFSSSVMSDYITIRKASDNSLLVHGSTPVSLAYEAGYDSLEMHINTDASCNSQIANRIASVHVLCGCNNSFKYPGNDVGIVLGVNTISIFQWPGDYNVTTGYMHGALCTYTSSVATDFISIRKVSNNQLLASGLSPVHLTYDATMGSIEMHINTNASCGTENINRTTTVTMGYSIYKGGHDDGFAATSFDQGDNPVLTMYRGGNDDGFVSISFDQGDNPVLTMYRGGNDDGFVSTSFDQGDNPVLTLYRGGIDDGFVATSFDQGDNPMLTMYRGGNDDGFVAASFDQGANPVLIVYRGGIDDGFNMSCYEQCDGTATRWLGNQNISWHDYRNWECGILPTMTSDVVIPNGVLFFPTVSANDVIHSLSLNPGASIDISPPAELRLKSF